jgi:hypothetical protein
MILAEIRSFVWAAVCASTAAGNREMILISVMLYARRIFRLREVDHGRAET